MNSKQSIVLWDRLGREFELSRNVKQSVFSKRKDISTELKAEIYFKQNKKNEEFDEKLNELEGKYPLIKEYNQMREMEENSKNTIERV